MSPGTISTIPAQSSVYAVNIEGTVHPWPRETITMEEIATLGGWPAAEGVIEVREDNTERTVAPGEIVGLQPGREFARRIRWRRGLSRPERLELEIALLRKEFPGIERSGDWVRIPGLPLPTGWSPTPSDVVFMIPNGYPVTPPSGFFMPSSLTFNGRNSIGGFSPQGSPQPPFPGTWGSFSWGIEPNDWKPTGDFEHGPGLRRWVRSFRIRLEEGA